MTTSRSEGQFHSTVDGILSATWEFYPNRASRLGLHEYDGRLSDLSRRALERRSEDLRTGLKALEKIEVPSLTKQDRLDHSLLTTALNKELFELTELKIQQTNPMEMLWHIELSNYVKREYAPLRQRVDSLVSALVAVPSVIVNLKAGLRSTPQQSGPRSQRRGLRRDSNLLSGVLVEGRGRSGRPRPGRAIRPGPEQRIGCR